MSKKLIYLLLFSCLLLDTSYAMAIEEPKFTVVTSRDGVEYRQYEAYMVAATLIAGVILWIFMSDLRFQSDAAILLSFMLIVNVTELIEAILTITIQPPVRASAGCSNTSVATIRPTSPSA